MQRMIEQGARLEAERISIWEDCGTREALLQTNRYLLGKNGTGNAETRRIANYSAGLNCRRRAVRRSIIGPNVSISEGRGD